MPYTEVIVPHIKPDEASREGFRDALPQSIKILQQQKGLETGFYGFMIEEDGENVESDFRFVLFPVWEAHSDFETFLQSPAFGTFVAPIVPFMAGIAKPEMYETNLKPTVNAELPFTQIVRTNMSAPDSIDKAKEAWENVTSAVKGDDGINEEIVHGVSLNLDGKVYIGVLGWHEKADIRENSNVQKLLAQLGEIGNTSVLYTKFSPFGTIA